MDYQYHYSPYDRHQPSIGEFLMPYIQKYWFRAVLVFLVAHLYLSRDITIQFNMSDKNLEPAAASMMPTSAGETVKEHEHVFRGKGANTSVKNSTPNKNVDSRKANDFYNITFILSPDYGKRKGIDPAIVREKRNNCKRYVERFSKIARTEREMYGIPASITLAQGLLESDAGGSRLSVESNNHFGIKCRSKCRGCTCRNYTDDSRYDMFRVFNSAWESYREHSKLLTGSRYKHLLNLPVTDYEGWAHGLKKAGYATDKRYAEKLIKIIEEMKLYKYDR
jgi:flagellum-specific peptidoglycan hydrolase FlgJ